MNVKESIIRKKIDIVEDKRLIKILIKDDSYIK